MATEWKKVRLGDIATVTSSKRVFANQYTKTGIPFYRQKEIIEKNRGEELSEQLFISNELYRKMKMNYGVPQKNDLLITGVGVTLGIPYLVKDETFYFKDGNLIWLKDISENVNSQFIFYYINSAEGQKTIWARTIGSAQPALTIDLVKQFQFPCPPLETQQKIAGILSAYDDLIENNRKQIKLLEEAAQKLYKEWFVKLNFPGHENVKIVDGVPEGWKKGTVFDLGEFKRGKTITKDQTILGPIPVVAGGLEPAYYHNESNTDSPVITVSGSGANAGFTRMYYEKVWASDCSYLDISKCENLYFVYCILKNSKAEIENLQKGAAQPHVYAKDVNDINTLIPCQELLEKFSAVVKAYFEKIRAVQKQIIDLQSARDKLLPKLMNGELI